MSFAFALELLEGLSYHDKRRVVNQGERLSRVWKTEHRRRKSRPGFKHRRKKRKLPGCTGRAQENSVEWVLERRGEVGRMTRQNGGVHSRQAGDLPRRN